MSGLDGGRRTQTRYREDEDVFGVWGLGLVGDAELLERTGDPSMALMMREAKRQELGGKMSRSMIIKDWGWRCLREYCGEISAVCIPLQRARSW